ncbi:hypothetical protein POM88_008132 [Heracleum sosnowskyi]|uniref:F-box domain-containing protein n=1 Tax=Heracleum sosnowskyi TaxID=360622 RepID=A0AAD8N680_9APIA|nr:hypothetical protein POM88_008132 [Heracleum sosnowskyi]
MGMCEKRSKLIIGYGMPPHFLLKKYLRNSGLCPHKLYPRYIDDSASSERRKHHLLRKAFHTWKKYSMDMMHSPDYLCEIQVFLLLNVTTLCMIMARNLQLSVREETSISDIPEDVLGLILSRVPARSLLSCQCVCKRFNAVSRNPIVLAAHVKRASTSNTTTFCSVFHYHSDGIEDRYDHVLLENTDDSVSFSHVRPSNPVTCDISIVGSCNGLICAEIEAPSDENGGCFLIWNPVTRENRFVEKPNVNALRTPHTMALAFGFSHKTNDYKLVRIVSYLGLDYPSTVEVYNLSTERWSANDVTTLPCLEPDKVPPYFNNPFILFSISSPYFIQPLKKAFHWLADTAGIEDRLSKAVVSFDLEEEQLKLFSWLHPFKIPLVELGILDSLNDKLSLIVPRIDSPNPGFDIWVMSDYGYQDSWTRLLTVEQFDGFAMPVGYWKDDLLIMAKMTMEERYMFFYNLKTQESTRPRRLQLQGTLFSEAQNQELVELLFGIYVGRKYFLVVGLKALEFNGNKFSRYGLLRNLCSAVICLKIQS